VNLQGDELRAAYACAAEAVRGRVNRRAPVPQWLQKHFQRLDLEVRVSRTRPESSRAGEEFDDQDPRWIGTPEAAAILDWSTRKVQRLAADLDGQRVAGRWMFRESAVRDYAKETRNGCSRSRS
jgi:hypothetical protein